MKVKICGVTNKEDAKWSLNYGADFLGFNFSPQSPRKISMSKAAEIIHGLPGFAVPVGVFVNADQKEIVDACLKTHLKGLQLHGDETPNFISGLKLELEGAELKPFIIKAFRVENQESLAELGAFKGIVDYFLLDARVPGQVGGTGKTFDWALAHQAKELGVPIFLAGGLTPENVSDAVQTVHPFAVDVASGVESKVRTKDSDKLKKFIEEAKTSEKKV